MAEVQIGNERERYNVSKSVCEMEKERKKERESL